MLIPIIIVGIALMILERVIPDQKLPVVSGWWKRVIVINFIQLGVVFLGTHSWDRWFLSSKGLISLDFPSPIAGFISYLGVTFVFYWWHRWRHDLNTLWLLLHQIHHSPNRIETITSFYKHPLEIIFNSLLMGSINYLFFGLSIQAAAWCLLYSSFGEYFYHMNIKTPHWVGYFFQRPEMHRIHHQQGKHYNNFSDLPLWDMCFGTFKNPQSYYGPCGFKALREQNLFRMLRFENINNPFPKTSK